MAVVVRGMRLGDKAEMGTVAGDEVAMGLFAVGAVVSIPKTVEPARELGSGVERA
jgi:hypothetical protein